MEKDTINPDMIDLDDTTIDWNDRMADSGRLQQARGRIRETWGDLTDDDIDSAQGNWDRMVGTVKEKTGEAADAIERKLKDIFR